MPEQSDEKSFRALGAKHRQAKPGYCPLCDKPTKGIVSMQLQQRAENKTSGRGKSVASRSVSMCEGHAVEIYEAVHETLEERMAAIAFMRESR